MRLHRIITDITSSSLLKQHADPPFLKTYHIKVFSGTKSVSVSAGLSFKPKNWTVVLTPCNCNSTVLLSLQGCKMYIMTQFQHTKYTEPVTHFKITSSLHWIICICSRQCVLLSVHLQSSTLRCIILFILFLRTALACLSVVSSKFLMKVVFSVPVNNSSASCSLGDCCHDTMTPDLTDRPTSRPSPDLWHDLWQLSDLTSGQRPCCDPLI